MIDTSAPFTQENFSRKWNVLTQAPLTTYFQPRNEAAKPYRREIDKDWRGALPYSVLYSRGKKKREWKGILDFAAVAREVEALCR